MDAIRQLMEQLGYRVNCEEAIYGILWFRAKGVDDEVPIIAQAISRAGIAADVHTVKAEEGDEDGDWIRVKVLG